MKSLLSQNRGLPGYDCGYNTSLLYETKNLRGTEKSFLHFLLHCPLYDIMRQDCFGHLENILEFNVADMDSKSLCDLLLFGKPDLDVSLNMVMV